jgi:hypothetical protein
MDELELVGRFGEVEALPAEAIERAERILRAAMAVDADPTPLTPRRRRRMRPRRLLTSAATATILIATATAIVIASTGQNASPTHRGAIARRIGRTTTSADIRARVVDALSANTNTILLVQSMMTTPGLATTEGPAWYYPWNGQPGLVREAGSSWNVGDPASKQEWDLSFTMPRGDSSQAGCKPTTMPRGWLGWLVIRSPIKARGITIYFSNDTWQPTVVSCFPVAPGLDAPSVGAASNIQTMVADGLLRVVGHPALHGQPTIELRLFPHGVLTLRLWVSASTYLPVQAVATGPTGDPNPGKTWTEVDQYAFLNPTAANLAHLRISVPPGFTKAPSSSAQG